MRYIFILLTVTLFSCIGDKNSTPVVSAATGSNNFIIYSSNVKDTFHISVALPDTTGREDSFRYPIIYILDANLYFDIYAEILKKYSEAGLLPKAILVGIGYKNFQSMDSLRQRDYTYPVAIPEYEMPVSGKADLFSRFISSELIPAVESRVAEDSSKRILIGHSLGGYFTMYSLLENIRHHETLFHGFIAASPSLHYNNAYLPNEFDSLSVSPGASGKLFICFGQKENEELKAGLGQPIDSFFRQLSTILVKQHISVKTANYSEMGHMDTQIPAFIQGGKWMVGN